MHAHRQKALKERAHKQEEAEAIVLQQENAQMLQMQEENRDKQLQEIQKKQRSKGTLSVLE